MKRRVAMLVMALAALPAAAEQYMAFDDVEVHYAVVNTLFLEPDVAGRYGIVRGKDRAIVNVSVLDANGEAIAAQVSGTTINLLSQQAPLRFSEVREGEAIYYIASLTYTDRDVLRFRIAVDVDGRETMNVEFQQQMFVEPDS
jgi:Domain of unknown function (DUF4426)